MHITKLLHPNDVPNAERKKVKRRNEDYCDDKVLHNDTKIKKETIEKSFKHCGIKAPALKA